MLIKDNVLLLHNITTGIKQRNMKVTLLQTNITWAEPSDNQRNAEEMISQAQDSDMYILPEMWSTGFATQPHGIAEDEETSGKSGSLAWMKDMAARKKAAICGSLAIRTCEGQYVNRLYFVFPDGTYRHYDKRHLFSMGGENAHYTAGGERIIVEYKGVRFLLMICYDLRFPVWSRNSNDYDAVIYVANWPTPRLAVWDALLKARALENQCFAIGVNRTGTDPNCEYSGGSAIISPYGKVMAECGNETKAATADLCIEELQRFRKKFPVLDDRDNFSIQKNK